MVKAAIKKSEDAKLSAQYDKWVKSVGTTTDAEGKVIPNGEFVPTAVTLQEPDVLAVVEKEVKQRRDSIEQFQRANRTDLVEKEQAELAILTTYLPEQMSRADIESIVRAAIEQVGAKGPGDKGKVMPLIMPQTRGKADGAEVNAMVTKILASFG